MKRILLFVLVLVACKESKKPKIVVSDAYIDSIVKAKQAVALQDFQSSYSTEIYDTLHLAFEGYPDEKKMKGLFEAILTSYRMPVTTANVKGLATLLLALRKRSVMGVTEMDILTHIYQSKNSRLDLPTQAEMSFNIIEKTK